MSATSKACSQTAIGDQICPAYCCARLPLRFRRPIRQLLRQVSIGRSHPRTLARISRQTQWFQNGSILKLCASADMTADTVYRQATARSSVRRP